MSTNPEAIGSRVRRLRREKTDLNQAELARAIQIDPATLNQIERGKRQPSADTIARLAKHLGVSADYLMMGSPGPALPSPADRAHENNDTGQAHDNHAPRAAPPLRRPSFDLSATIRAEILATLAVVFAEIAADLEARYAQADTHGEADPLRTAERLTGTAPHRSNRR